jgi:hypothetical protein
MKHSKAPSARTLGSPTRMVGGLALLSIALISASTAMADLSINIQLDAPPPPPRQEVIVGVSPGPDYVWVGGYWDGSPGHYTWVGGRWDHPPHGQHGQWFAPHWDKDRDGHYHQTKGEWRDGPKH